MRHRSARSPARFAAARHLISHPDDGPGELARHCRLQLPTASRALRALLEETALDPAALLEAMKRTRERPRWRSFHFRAPNPAQWLKAAKLPYFLSGERAAELVDGLNVASDKTLVYVNAHDVEKALATAKKVFAKSCSPRLANLTIRVADAWMANEGNVAEKGQRWYDYATSANLQLARWRP